MPKARKSTSRALHFQVSPWQTRLGKENAAAGHDDTTDVQFVDLVKPAQEEPLEAAGPSRVAQLANGDAPWISKGRKGAQPPNSQSEEPSSQQAPIPAVGSTVAPAEAEAGSTKRQQDGEPEAEEPVQEQDTEAGAACSDAHDIEDDGFDLQPSSSCSSALQGVCHLALLPSGHMSGHVIQDRTRRPFGVMARCVSSPSATPGCIEDADVDVLKLRLLNFQTNEEVEAVVARSGGDMSHITPAEPWQLRKYLGINDGTKADELLELQVSFNAEELLHGADAEVYLQRFNPRLVGRDAVINRGMLQVTGLPPVFLATS